MSATKNCRTDWKNVVDYVSHREHGRCISRHNQITCDLLSSTRRMKPLIAATSSNCRSTYLLRLNPTNVLLAAAHGDHSIAVYCATTGILLAKCIGHEKSPWTLTFHPSQPYLLASGCLGGSIRLWNLDCLANADGTTQSDTLHFSCTKVWKHTGAIASLAFHPTHSILVAAWSQEVVFYDWVSGRKLSVWRFVSNHSRVRWVRFSPDGSLLYTATANPSIVQHQLTSAPTSEDQHGTTSITAASNGSTKAERYHTPTTHTEISRDALLEFLISQPDAWFHQLGVCSACSVRLCRWASTLGPEFPSSKVDIHRGTALITLVAQSVASRMRLAGLPLSHVVKELLPSDASQPLSEVAQRLLGDANPAAVAIIEDIPVQEFLLSRGNYCPTPSRLIGDGGLCCGGHACDLVLAHRDLMRYSICRSCLTAFWRWASRYVSWWHWSNRGIDTKHLSRTPEHVSFPVQSSQSRIFNSDVSTKNRPGKLQTGANSAGVGSQPPAGICIRCHAGGNVPAVGFDCDVTTEKPNELDRSQKPPSTSSSPAAACDVSLRSIPMAALELLQSRLSNANDVTQVTYMAAELVAEGELSKRIGDLLRSDLLSGNPIKPLPEAFLQLLQRATIAHGNLSSGSPLPKRRRISGRDDTFRRSNASPTLMSHDEADLPVTTTIPYHPTTGLAEQAALFGQFMLSTCADQTWNRPSCVQVRHLRSARPDHSGLPHLELFPYVPAGSRLLRPTITTKVQSSCMDLCSTARSCTSTSGAATSTFGSLTRNESDESLRALEPSADVDGINGRSMTACCRCGHIVPQTFPIDPQSSLSAVVCEKLVLSEERYHPTSALSDHLARRRFSLSRESTPNSSQTGVTRLPGSTPTNADPVTDSGLNTAASMAPSSVLENNTTNSTSLSTHSTATSTDQLRNTHSEHGTMLNLINLTSTDSVLHAMNRSITEVIAGLFVNMGEHGSANCLQDTTYRVCRWELNLCGPIQADCLRCSPRKSDTGSPSDELSFPQSFLPMPANVAVSYNSNSLVIPHARLFNDSSICLSPDGRMLAALVAPRSTSRLSSPSLRELGNFKQTELESEHTSDTLLAVYRLQPNSRRGQCLFARRLTTCSPVCLDFSPLSDFLAVGMATSRLPSAALPPASFRRLTAGGLLLDTAAPASRRDELLGVGGDVNNEVQLTATTQVMPMRHAFVAKIFHLERKLRSLGDRGPRNFVVRKLQEVTSVQHPGLCNPVSSSPSADGQSRDRWHRLLLSSPTGISLNTIVWNPRGGLFYGTTKGLVVLMQSQPCQFRSHVNLNLSSMFPTPNRDERQLEEQELDDLFDNTRAKHRTSASSSVGHPAWAATTSTRFVRFSLPDSSPV